jgi:DNA repair exonuclease SbcCD ATPase subunit
MDRIVVKRCRLQNFEGYVDGEIEFSEGFSAIVGPSCSGKTSISRALRAVCIPKSFSQGWVREGQPFCLIRWESNIGWLEAKKGEGINEFEYEIFGDSKGVVKMKSPGETAFEIAKKILGVESIRIESVGDKKKVGSRVDVNMMKQSSPEGLLGETGKNKQAIFDTLCGISDSEDIREGIKVTLRDKKKTNDELVSQLSQIRAGGIPEKKVQEEREAYNDLADSFDDITSQKQTFIEIMSSFSIITEKTKEVETIGNSLQKDYKLPVGGVIDLFRTNTKKWMEELTLIQRLLNECQWASVVVASTTDDIEKLKAIPKSKLHVEALKANQLFYVEQFLAVQSALSKVETDIEKLGKPIDIEGLKKVISKKKILDQWMELDKLLSDAKVAIDKLAVGCSPAKAKELNGLVESAREVYKRWSAVSVAVGDNEKSISKLDDEIMGLVDKKKGLLDGIDTCPITGKIITEFCSVWQLKQEGKE